MIDAEKAGMIERFALHQARMDSIETSARYANKTAQSCSQSQEYLSRMELDHKAFNLLISGLLI